MLDVEGLRSTSHPCFASPENTEQLHCPATLFAFPQTGTIEGRLVRLETLNGQARYLRRADVRSPELAAAPRDLPRSTRGTSAVTRANAAAADPNPIQLEVAEGARRSICDEDDLQGCVSRGDVQNVGEDFAIDGSPDVREEPPETTP